jgi:glycosyltransferase involved in cell wall biosynthesis
MPPPEDGARVPLLRASNSPVERPILLSVIVPVFNENGNLVRLVDELEAALADVSGAAETILVDDGSTDGSWGVIAELARTRGNVSGIRFLANRGQTAAMVAGIAESRGELIAFLDADLQNDPGDLVRMLEPILAGDADMVCGWRRDRKDGMSRTLASRVANALIRKSFSLKIHDLGCTLKVCRRVFLDEIQLFGEMHRFIPIYAQAQGARLIEMPVNHRPRAAGVSKYGMNRIGKVLVDLLTAKMLNTYGSKPAYFFGRIAMAFFTLGTAAFAVVAYRTFALERPQSTPMIFFMLLAYVTGLLCLMSGLLAELNIRVLYQAGGRKPYRVIERTPGHSDDAGA